MNHREMLAPYVYANRHLANETEKLALALEGNPQAVELIAVLNLRKRVSGLRSHADMVEAAASIFDGVLP